MTASHHPASGILQTLRLDLIPATLEHLVAELNDPADLGRLLDVTIPEGWPPGEYDREALTYFRDRLQVEGPAASGWYVWYAATRCTNARRDRLIASAGFFGPPVGGVVEIGYSVVASARGQGYAPEIVAALVDHAFSSGLVQEVIAHTTDGNPASTQVLLRCGFARAGEGREPGTILYRRRKVARL